jgi:hypothetical protein
MTFVGAGDFFDLRVVSVGFAECAFDIWARSTTGDTAGTGLHGVLYCSTREGASYPAVFLEHAV